MIETVEEYILQFIYRDYGETSVEELVLTNASTEVIKNKINELKEEGYKIEILEVEELEYDNF
jgi:biotin operon repressor